MEDATIVDYGMAKSRDVSKSKQARFLRRFHRTPAFRSEWRAEVTNMYVQAEKHLSEGSKMADRYRCSSFYPFPHEDAARPETYGGDFAQPPKLPAHLHSLHRGIDAPLS